MAEAKIYNEASVSAIADKIRERTGEAQKYKLREMPSGIDAVFEKGFEDGKQAQYDAFWDTFQQNGERNNYPYAFYGPGWTDENYDPKYPLTVKGGNQMYQASLITDTKVPIDMTKNVTNSQVFSWAQRLVTVNKVIFSKDITYNASIFTWCYDLENVTVEGEIGCDMRFHDSSKLSADSIKSVIGHLSDTASGKTLTLSQTAVNNMGNDVDVRLSSSGQYSGWIYSEPIWLKAGQRLKITLDDVGDGHRYEDWYEGGTPQDYCVCLTIAPGIMPIGNTTLIYTANADKNMTYSLFIATDKAISDVMIRVRAVLVDENGNELTGENLLTFTEGTHGNLTVSNVSAWDALVASKPNWTVSLV